MTIPHSVPALTPYEPPLTGLARLGYIVPTPQPSPESDRATMARVLDHICPIPDPCDSASAFARYHHGDLPAMHLDELRRERRSVQRRLDLEARPSGWLLERLDAIRQELALRKRPRHAHPSPGGPEADPPTGDAGACARELPGDREPADLSRPYHTPLPGLRRTVRGLRTTLRSGL